MKRAWLSVMILAVAGCAPNTDLIPDPSPEMAMALGVGHAELVRGHAAYLQHCNRCHERVPPGKIDPEFWRGIVPHMAAKARISRKAEEELLLYVMAAHGTVHGLDLEH